MSGAVDPRLGAPGELGTITTPAIADFHVFQADRDTARLTWRLMTPEWLRLRVMRRIDGGEWTTIDKVWRTEHFLDRAVPLGSLARNISYGLVIEGRSETPVVSAALDDTRRDRRAAAMTRKERMLLRRRGFPVVWFAFRSEGPRCSCFNIVTERSNDDNCPLCHGTTRVGGYSDPAVIYMAGMSPQQRNTMLGEVGEIEQSHRFLWTTAEWRLRNKDVLITAGMSRYRVEGVVQNSIAESPTMQVAKCLEINKGDIEYDLEIPANQLAILFDKPDLGTFL